MYSRQVRISRGALLFIFFACKERYAIKRGKRENDVVFCFVFNVNSITLQLVVNQECQTTNLGS